MSKVTDYGFKFAKQANELFFGNIIDGISRAAAAGKWQEKGWTGDYGVGGWLQSMSVQYFASDEDYKKAHVVAFKAINESCRGANNYSCVEKYAASCSEHLEAILTKAIQSPDKLKGLSLDGAILNHMKVGIDNSQLPNDRKKALSSLVDLTDEQLRRPNTLLSGQSYADFKELSKALKQMNDNKGNEKESLSAKAKPKNTPQR